MIRSAFSRLSRLSACLAVAGTLTFATPIAAQGDLLVAPTRVILDGRRGTEVILSNIGSEEATYRIGIELRRMTPEGQLIEVEPEQANALEQAAMEMIRYAPRRITLPPGQPQAVRLSARPGAELPDGEYRVHMSFRAIPKPQPVEERDEQEQGIKIKLIPIYGITIPIIIRHGRLQATVALSDPHIVADEQRKWFQLTMQRAGDSSTYGEIRVLKRGSDEPVYMARGVAIYPEVGQRKITLPLSEEQAAALQGPVRIEYREMPEAGGGLIAALDTAIG